MCCVRQWNLSYGSLTSYEAREKLRALKTEEPSFWSELTASMTHDLPGLNEHSIEEDTEKDDDGDNHGDDSSLEMSTLLSALETGEVASNVFVGGNGGLVPQPENEADDVEAEPVEVVVGESAVGKDGDNDKTSAVPTTVESQQTIKSASDGPSGRGKRQKFGNKWYDVKDFMRH
jgi:hypothetical protein